MTQEVLKEQAGRYAANEVKDGMVVGLGTGSTAYYFVDEIGKRVKQGLNIVGVTTSNVTKQQAEKLGIPLKSLDEVEVIDVVVDGADESTHSKDGIKGGGGALLYEKLVAKQAKKIVWVVDETKVVDKLGAFPLPVEVIPYGHTHLMRYFEQKGYKPVLRHRNGKCFITDAGNYIIDLHLEVIENPNELAAELQTLVGVVEHGLFLNMTHTVLVATKDGVKEIDNV